jgi:FkbM family methyltransferase
VTYTIFGRLPSPLGHVLHIGAGIGEDLAGYLEAGAHAVTLVEPDPVCLPQLRAAVASHADVRIIEAAVSADSLDKHLRRFNFTDLNSLRDPTGLRELFPGLEGRPAEKVRVLDPVALVREMNLCAEHAHVLVLEAPGEGMSILRALVEAGLLVRFSAVRVQEGVKELYEGAGTLADLRGLLESVHFSRDAILNEGDPDRPILTVLFDSVAAELTSARKDLEKAEAARSDAQAQVDSLSAVLDEQALELGALKEERSRLRNQLTEAEAQLQVQCQRDQSFREEMLRAEAQIEIIKDLLLRKVEL